MDEDDKLQTQWELTFSLQELGLHMGVQEWGIVDAADLTDEPEDTRPTNLLPEAKSVLVVGVSIPDPLLRMITQVPSAQPGRLGCAVPRTLEFWLQRYVNLLTDRGYKAVIDKRPLASMPTYRHNRMFQLAGWETEIGSRPVGGYTVGKNHLVVSKVHGSRMLMAALYTNAVLTPSQPYTEDLCGDCTACIDACPSGALTNGKYDPEICSSYTSKPENQIKLSNVSYITCDMCMRACPIGTSHWPSWGASWPEILQNSKESLLPEK